jgi:hypothetical protein
LVPWVGAVTNYAVVMDPVGKTSCPGLEYEPDLYWVILQREDSKLTSSIRNRTKTRSV